ncbi:MAG: hypothetical protein AAGH88_04530 [Planctomycetota bacterium]
MALPSRIVLADGEGGAAGMDLPAAWVQTVSSFPDGIPRDRATLEQTVLPTLGGFEIPMTDLAVGPDGSVYLLCNVMPMRDGQLKNHVVLVKYSAGGEREWSRQVPPPEGGMIIAFGIAADRAGNAYLAGWYQRDEGGQVRQYGYIASYAADGESRWSYEVEHLDLRAGSRLIGIDVRGDRVYAVGSAYGQVTRRSRPEVSSRSALAVCVNARNGREVWSQQYQGQSRESTNGIGVAVTSRGRVCISGLYDADPLPSDNFPKDRAGFVMGLKANGEADWSIQVGKGNPPAGVAAGQITSLAFYLAAGRSDEVYVFGQNEADTPRRGVRRPDVEQTGRFIARVSSRGRVEWTTLIPRQFEPFGSGIRQGRHRVGPDGHVHIPCIIDSNIGYPGIIRLDPAGQVLGLQVLSKQRHYDELDAIGFGPAGGIVISGQHVVPGDGNGRGGLFDENGVQRHENNRLPAQPPAFFAAALDVLGE